LPEEDSEPDNYEVQKSQVFRIRENRDGTYRIRKITKGRSRKVVVWVRDYLGLNLRDTVDIAF
jgi:hypothetical protein